MGAGASTGASTIKNIQSFLNRETDIKNVLKRKFTDVDFDHLNQKDIDYVKDTMDTNMKQMIEDRLMGKGVITSYIMGGRSRRRRRKKKTTRKTRRDKK
jgi:hypothetical protein